MTVPELRVGPCRRGRACSLEVLSIELKRRVSEEDSLCTHLSKGNTLRRTEVREKLDPHHHCYRRQQDGSLSVEAYPATLGLWPGTPQLCPSPRDVSERPCTVGGGWVPGPPPPLLPFQCLRLTVKVLLRRQEDLSVQNSWPAFVGDHRGTWEEGGPS